ncbi:MAG: DinB family protein [Acidobacteria bacterium]|nr:DinB family protein [Acidobacteriota bacterium]
MMRPAAGDYPSSFQAYVDRVPETDIVPALAAQIDVVRRFAAAVPADTERFAYAPGKWTLRQAVGHLGDIERVFGYRALAFSRGDTAALPGIDENAYVEHATFNDATLADLVEELALLRRANVCMFRTLTEAQWAASGVANGRSITVRALAFVLAGHVRHHLDLFRDRYGVAIDG